jgi:hypothetical protein
MDEIFEFETTTGGLVLLDPTMFDLLEPSFAQRLAIVMDPKGENDSDLGEEPWPKKWLRAAEPLQLLQEEGQFQVVLTGEGVFHLRVTDEKHGLRSQAESACLCGTLRVASDRLVLAESWPEPEEAQEFELPSGDYQLWLYVLPVPPEVTRTVGVFGVPDWPFLALELSREPAENIQATSFPPRVPLPEDALEPHPGWLCRATVKRSEGDFLLLDLQRTRRITSGQARLAVRPGEGLHAGDRVVLRMLNQAQGGYWNAELDRRL